MAKNFLDRENFINYVEEKDKLFRGEKNYFSVVGEKCLTSDYGKSWREKVRMLLNEEVGFFVDRVLELRSRILWTIRSYRKEKGSDDYTRKLVEINEKELENITEKEFYGNESKNGVRRLTVKEISDMLENFKTGTEEQLISEINRLKAENEELKKLKSSINGKDSEKLEQQIIQNERLIENGENISVTEVQEQVNKSQVLMNELNTAISPTKDDKGNGSFPYVIGGSVLVASIVIIGFLLKKNKRK